MKLLLDNIIFSLQKVGGISIYWKEIIKRAVNDPEIELFFISKPSDQNNFIYQELIAEEPLVVNIPTASTYINNRYLPLITHKRTFNIFHSSYYRPLYMPGVKKVVTIHDFIYEKFDKGLRKGIHSIQKTAAISNADIVVCISENTKTDLLTLYPKFSDKDIRVVYNGVSDGFHQLLSKDPKNPYLLVVGNRVGCKNFQTTIQAFRKELYKDFKLKIVGRSLSEEEIQLFEGSIDRVDVLSNVTEKKLNELYNGAFALVFPSTYEGFGIPVIESMKAGCPVITTTSSCMKEVGGNAAIYMERIDADSIIQAVDRLKETSFRNTAIKRGIEHSHKFSWNKTYTEIKDIYRELSF